MTYNDLIYLCMDELKMVSDDAFYTNDHIIFLLAKYRTFLLKQRYSDIKKQIPESNYQNICLDLTQVPAIPGGTCEGTLYLRSKERVPTTMKIGNPRVYPIDFYQGDITYISRDRMRYTGHNRFLQNIIYCSKSPDGYLYFKSGNPQFLHMEQVRFSAIFEDIKKASEFECESQDDACELEDREFPMEDALVPVLVELVVKELRGPEYSPKDQENNSKDDLGGITQR